CWRVNCPEVPSVQSVPDALVQGTLGELPFEKTPLAHACMQCIGARQAWKLRLRTTQFFLDVSLRVKGRPPSLPVIHQIRPELHCNQSGPGWVIRARSCAHKPRSPKRG